MADQFEVFLGIVLIMAGLLLAFLSFIIRPSTSRGTEKRSGAVIIIGPFPIVLGTDKETAKTLLILAILLVVVLVALFILQVL